MSEKCIVYASFIIFFTSSCRAWSMDKTCVPPASVKHNIPVSPSAIRSTDKEDADTAAKINSLEKKTISVYVFL